MTVSLAPSGFDDIEEWILHVIYEQPNANHMTHTLFQRLEQVLQGEPSQRELINSLREHMGNPPLSEEEYIAENKLQFGQLQTAVETLIEQGWARGIRDTSADGVYFKNLKLTPKGEAAAIRGKRKREKSNAAIPNLEERIRTLRERAVRDGDEKIEA